MLGLLCILKSTTGTLPVLSFHSLHVTECSVTVICLVFSLAVSICLAQLTRIEQLLTETFHCMTNRGDSPGRLYLNL